jgi:hypothetical protein
MQQLQKTAKMIVFVLLESWAMDFDSGAKVRVYAHRNEAVEAMKKTFELYKSENPDYAFEAPEDDCSATTCSVWKDGDYTRNHFDFIILSEPVI